MGRRWRQAMAAVLTFGQNRLRLGAVMMIGRWLVRGIPDDDRRVALIGCGGVAAQGRPRAAGQASCPVPAASAWAEVGPDQPWADDLEAEAWKSFAWVE